MSKRTIRRTEPTPRAAETILGATDVTESFSGTSIGHALLRPLRAFLRYRRAHPIISFVAGVIVLMGGFYALYLPEWEHDIIGKFLPWNLARHAEWSGGVIRAFGNEVTVHGTLVSSGGEAMRVVRGCDALEPLALFLAAVISFPARLRAKMLGILIGILLMEATNVVRLVSLFYVLRYWPRHFDMMHHEVWQAGFIVLSVVYWALWAVWATRPQEQKPDVATSNLE